ncbi:terminase [Frigoribacterium sp. PhB160]|uniref:terminase n=1 Tax=Frigoribacterium sp. PhB160 TaxID=2485192 RepID=UPI0018F3AC17|nr:terminase [Frigoribacterium sp. PhB160]
MSETNSPQMPPPTPRNLNAAGRKLWDASTDPEAFEWAQHELAILEEACRTRDRIVQLDQAVASDGVMISSSQGSRVHPAIGESRQQRLALARLLYTLGIPPLEDDVLPKTAGVRGFYRGSATR